MSFSKCISAALLAIAITVFSGDAASGARPVSARTTTGRALLTAAVSHKKANLKATVHAKAAKVTAKPTKKAARPKTMLTLTASERDRVERIVMTSCGELGDYQMAKANAQVIYDRIKSGRFGKSVFSVLNAPGQFETSWHGRVNRLVRQAVAAVFDRGERVTSTAIYYYENPHLREISAAVWNRGKRYVATVGNGFYIHQYWTDSD